MSSGALSALAASGLGVLAWLWMMIVERPGTNIFAAIAAGLTAFLVVRLIVAAARADARERVRRDGDQ